MKGIYANETKNVNKDFAYTTVVGQYKPKDVVCKPWKLNVRTDILQKTVVGCP